jgi:hypothetical protein
MTTGNGLPPLPKPPSAARTETVELTLPGDLFDDLKKAATAEQMDLPTAVAMCVHLWRFPPPPPDAPTPRRRASKPRA